MGHERTLRRMLLAAVLLVLVQAGIGMAVNLGAIDPGRPRPAR